MSADAVQNSVGDSSSNATKPLMIWLLTISVALGAGFATPLLFFSIQQSSPGSIDEPPKIIPVSRRDEVDYIDMPEIVAVLGKARFSRYLRINISLQINQKDRLLVEKLIVARDAVLRDRVLALVAELREEELGGRHGNNQIRRRLHHIFNELLFDDGIERIQDILFRDFQIQ